VLDVFRQSYHWSLMQVEYATDLVFRSVGTLRPLYEHLARESVLSVKVEQIASFLGRQISPQLAQEIGSQFSTRIEGTCIKHRFASSTIKMYDKYGCVLRIETTISSNKAQRGNPRNLVERRVELVGRRAAEPALEFGKDRFLAVAAHADDEWKPELLATTLIPLGKARRLGLH
jgi:hypothetical protein